MPILFAHGICHLMGYDHERDEDFEKMSKAEAYILNRYEQFLPVKPDERKHSEQVMEQ